MKILQVLPYFTWSYGGPVRVVYDLSQSLSRRGHDVTIYTTDVCRNHRLTEKNKVELEDNIKIRYFRCVNNWIANEMKLHISPQMRSAIKKELKTFDVVHLHEYRGVPNIYVWYYAGKYNIPYILQAHGASPRVIGKQNQSQTFSKILFDTIIGKKIVDGASKLIALTETEAEQYKKVGVDEDKIEIVPNGIDLSNYDNLPKRGEFRRRYFIEDDEKVILYLGRIHKIKGIDLLVEAFSDLVKELDARLIIAGPDDGFLSTLKKRIDVLKIGDKILFTGPLYGSDKLKAYVDADVYVLPSIYETFPVTVLEACICSTPVIVTDRCGIADFVEKVGYVVGYDKDQLRDVMLNILSNRTLRMESGNRGKKLARKEFDLDEIIESIEDIYAKVIENR